MLIPQDHYNMSIENEVKILSQFPTQEWRPQFHIASSWVKRNVGSRLKSETLDQAQAVIVATLADMVPPAELTA